MILYKDVITRCEYKIFSKLWLWFLLMVAIRGSLLMTHLAPSDIYNL